MLCYKIVRPQEWVNACNWTGVTVMQKNPSGLEIIVDAKVVLILSSDALVKVK